MNLFLHHILVWLNLRDSTINISNRKLTSPLLHQSTLPGRLLSSVPHDLLVRSLINSPYLTRLPISTQRVWSAHSLIHSFIISPLHQLKLPKPTTDLSTTRDWSVRSLIDLRCRSRLSISAGHVSSVPSLVHSSFTGPLHQSKLPESTINLRNTQLIRPLHHRSATQATS